MLENSPNKISGGHKRKNAKNSIRNSLCHTLELPDRAQCELEQTDSSGGKPSSAVSFCGCYSLVSAVGWVPRVHVSKP